MSRFNGSIVVSYNPVTAWERYSRTFGPDEFSNFHPEKRADGGYHRCKFRVTGNSVMLSELLIRGLGRHVSVYGQKEGKNWEGFIYEMALNTGGAEIRISLRDMANKVWVRYRITGTTDTVRSTVQEDLVSQARFGIKEFVLTGGELETAAVADQVAQSYVDLHSLPKPSATRISVGGGQKAIMEPFIEIEARGYMETLNWRTYNQTDNTGNQGVSAEVGDIITGVGQFVASTSIESNATLVTKVFDQDRFAGDILRDLARLGDGSYRRYITYMTNDRVFVFASAAPTTLRV